MSGFVYIMSNPSFQDGLIKIGMSDRDPTHRKSELETTGVPDKFHVEYYAFVSDHYSLERRVHRKLDASRPNKKREFFKCPIPEAIDLIRQIAGSSIEYEKVYYKSPNEIEKIKLERERVERNAESQRKQKELEKKKDEERKRQKQLVDKKSKDILLKIDDDHVKWDLISLDTATTFENYVRWFVVLVILPTLGLAVGDSIIAFTIVALGFWWGISFSKRDDQKSDRLMPIAKDEVDKLHGRLMNERDWVSSYDSQLSKTISSFKSRIYGTTVLTDSSGANNTSGSRTKNSYSQTSQILGLFNAIEANKRKLKELESQKDMVCLQNIPGYRYQEQAKFRNIVSSDASLEDSEPLEYEIKRIRKLIEKQSEELRRMK
jgi:hypothetical protein